MISGVNFAEGLVITSIVTGVAVLMQAPSVTVNEIVPLFRYFTRCGLRSVPLCRLPPPQFHCATAALLAVPVKVTVTTSPVQTGFLLTLKLTTGGACTII